MANLYTKTGDKGETGLVGGSRVPKDSPRVNCYGTIDETNSMLGLAYSLTENEYIKEALGKIQRKLFTLGAELASDAQGLAKLGSHVICEEDIKDLEQIVDQCTEIVGKQTGFVVPGVNQASAALHVARTIVRRAERSIISAQRMVEIRSEAAKYVNRLSDAIYALARLEETLCQKEKLRSKVTEMVKEKLGQSKEQTKAFNLETVKAMAELAEEKAKEIGVPVVFSAVDSGGNLMLLHRMEDSLLGSIDISINKAYTANALKMPTSQLAEASRPGQPLYGVQQTNDGRIVVFGGGYPYLAEGKIQGAIGVSGGTVEEDMSVAEYVLDRIGGVK